MRVMVTGATGSFGSAFIRHILAQRLTERVVAYARGEYPLARLAEGLGHPRELRCVIGDVRDRDRLDDALHRVDTVVHAAALKRLDTPDPLELYKTNLDGTINTVKAALSRRIAKVLFIGTDKAVAPVAAYGASKLAAELYVVGANYYGHPQTRLSAVRYGNVLGSRGSVVHLWRRELAAGSPLTITDVRMTRFWLTLGQAVATALSALERMEGGEVFVPHVPAARILDVARAVVGADPSYKELGVRGVEKLHEQLIAPDEVARTQFVASAAHAAGYVIYPALGAGPAESELPDGFEYRSDTWPERVGIDALRRLLDGIGAEP